MNREITPDSMLLRQLDGQWQKFAAMLLFKLAGREKVTLTVADVERFTAEFAPQTPVLFTHGHGDSIDFQIVSEEAAQRLAAHDRTMQGHA